MERRGRSGRPSKKLIIGAWAPILSDYLREDVGADYAHESIRRIQRMGDRLGTDHSGQAAIVHLGRSDRAGYRGAIRFHRPR